METQVEHWMGRGCRFILYRSDARALTEGYRSAVNKFRGSAVSQLRHTL